MKLHNMTVLITGGGSGIGFETAKLFSQQGHRVIITGRNKERLDAAAAQLKNTTAIQADINDAASVDSLVNRVREEFPQLDVLVNNAGVAYLYKLSGDSDAFSKATEEFATNFFSTIRLTEKLLPVLDKQAQAAIVNVTSIVAFAPGSSLPTYSASKAALHSYTQTLRLTLKSSAIRVFEVMPPLVDTDFARDIPGSKISPLEVAESILNGLKDDIEEIHVASTAGLYKLFLTSPEKALYHLNGIA